MIALQRTNDEVHRTVAQTSGDQNQNNTPESLGRKSVSMGAAVAIELTKPADGSDIIATGSLEYAKNEVIRLRNDLGYLAQKYGMSVMPTDADDLIKGNEEEDFKRLVAEVCHIRACLRLNTQASKRRTRCNLHDEPAAQVDESKCAASDDGSSGSDSDS
jgi:hypothetical protein